MIIIIVKGKINPLTKLQTIYENKKLEINKQKIFWHKWRESVVKWDCQKKPKKIIIIKDWFKQKKNKHKIYK